MRRRIVLIPAGRQYFCLKTHGEGFIKKARSAFSSMAPVFVLAGVWAGYMAYLKTGLEALGLAGFGIYAFIKLFIKTRPLSDEKNQLKFWRVLYEINLFLVTGFLTIITRMKGYSSTEGAMNTLGGITAAMLLIFMAGFMIYFGPAESTGKEPVFGAPKPRPVTAEDLQAIKDKSAFSFNLLLVAGLGFFTLYYYAGGAMMSKFKPGPEVKQAEVKPAIAEVPEPTPEKSAKKTKKAAVKHAAVKKQAKKEKPEKPVKQEKKEIAKTQASEEKTLYPSGSVNMLWKIKDGKRDGPFKRYYESGAIGQKGNYSNGKMDGEWNFYRENGFKFKTMVFDADKLISVSMYEPKTPGDAKAGKLSKSLQYVDGKLYRENIYMNGTIKTTKYYDKSGQVTLVE